MSSTKYELHITGEFKQDLKRCKKRGLPLDDLWAIVRKLLNGETLDPKHRVHQLHNDRKGQWECHIQPDWLLVWESGDGSLIRALQELFVAQVHIKNVKLKCCGF